MSFVNLSLHQTYEDHDNIHIGDESGLPITQTDSVSLYHLFNLANVLCAPSIPKNSNFSFINFVIQIKHPLNYFLHILLSRICL